MGIDAALAGAIAKLEQGAYGVGEARAVVRKLVANRALVIAALASLTGLERAALCAAVGLAPAPYAAPTDTAAAILDHVLRRFSIPAPADRITQEQAIRRLRTRTLAGAVRHVERPRGAVSPMAGPEAEEAALRAAAPLLLALLPEIEEARRIAKAHLVAARHGEPRAQLVRALAKSGRLTPLAAVRTVEDLDAVAAFLPGTHDEAAIRAVPYPVATITKAAALALADTVMGAHRNWRRGRNREAAAVLRAAAQGAGQESDERSPIINLAPHEATALGVLLRAHAAIHPNAPLPVPPETVATLTAQSTLRRMGIVNADLLHGALLILRVAYLPIDMPQ